MNNVIGIGKNQVCFTAMETVKGNLEASANINANKVGYFLTSGEGSINQELEILDDKQLRNGRSKRNPIRGRYNPGKYSFPTYVKPLVATASTDYDNIIEIDHLLKAALGGTVTYTAGVEYPLGSVLPTFNLFIKKDHTLFIGLGCTVNTLKASVKGSDVGTLTFDGEFMKMLYAGTTEVTSAAATGATTIEVSDATAYNMVPMASGTATVDKGAYIKFGTDTAAYQITAIDFSTNVLTVTPALADAVASGASVTGWTPPNAATTAWVERGDATHGKLGMTAIDAAGQATPATNFPTLDIELTLTNNVKYSVDEKDGSMYAQDFFTSEFRDVTGSVNLYFRTNDIKYWKMALDQTEKSLLIPIGNVAGHIMKFYFPHIEITTPNISGENEITQKFDFKALMYSAIDDEMKIILS